MGEQNLPPTSCLLTSENHLYCHLSKDLAAILKPLERHLDINYFDYQRYYHDGSLLFLAPWTSFNQRFFAKDLYPSFIEFDRNKESILILAPTASIPSAAEDPQKFIDNVSEAYKNDIFHRVYFAYSHANFFEIFGFGSSAPVSNISAFYWQRIELLKKFQSYFYSEAHSLIREGEKHKVMLPKFLSTTKSLQEVCETFSQEEYLKAISLKHYPVSTQQGVVKLTSKELQCLKLLHERHTSKEIAKVLRLSPRTIEDCLLNIKNKFGCESKFELIDIASENPIINFF